MSFSTTEIDMSSQTQFKCQCQILLMHFNGNAKITLPNSNL